MISIVNVSNKIKPFGEHKYEVRIYDGKTYKTIATFKHDREDGLSVCLLKASDASYAKNIKSLSDSYMKSRAIK